MRPRKTILCVEDNEQLLGIRKFLLETRGYRVVGMMGAAMDCRAHRDLLGPKRQPLNGFAYQRAALHEHGTTASRGHRQGDKTR